MHHEHAGGAHELRRRYVADHIDTASNAHVLVLCFDRLDRDLATARLAIARPAPSAAHESLWHAQELLGELAAMLDTDAWVHAGALLTVYDYLLRLLAKANMLKSDSLVAEAQRLVSEIGDAFRGAVEADELAGPSPVADAETDRPRLSLQA